MSAAEIIEGLQEAGTSPNDGDAFYFCRAFEVACEKAGPDELRSLSGLFTAFPPDSFYKARLFDALANAWLMRKVPGLLAPRPDFPMPAATLPSALSDYPQDLIGAVKLYRQVIAPFESLVAAKIPEQTKIDFQTNKPGFWDKVGRLFTSKGGASTEKILAYRWGGWCGTGSEYFRTPHSVALLVALVAEGRWAEAAGAALSVTPDSGTAGARRVLVASVPDPAKVLMGGLVWGDLKPRDYRAAKRREVLLALLLGMPGDQRVAQMIELARLAAPDGLPLYLCAIGKLIRRGTPPPGTVWRSGSFGDAFDMISVEPAGEIAEKDALDFLCSKATSNLTVEEAKTLAEIFKDKRRPETISALHRLLEHPSVTVAKVAAETLETLGQKVEIPPKTGPVRYSLRMQEGPFADRKVSWTVQRQSTSTGSTSTTDAAGVIELPRDLFLGQTDDPVSAIVLRSEGMDSPADPWFGITLPAPPDSDETIPVEVKTVPLRVRFSLPRPQKEMGPMEVIIRGAPDASSRNPVFWSPATFQLPVTESLDFQHLAPGVYPAEIRITGARTWTGHLRPGEVKELTIPMRRASDVTFQLLTPKGWHPNALLPELWQNGQRLTADWDYEKLRFRGFTEGRYLLHIPSSNEVKSRVRAVLPDGPKFQRTDIPFEIGPDAPAEIDLGRIPIKTE